MAARATGHRIAGAWLQIQRQTDEIARGGAIIQETRRWDDDLGVTQSMRTKEHAHDYRYFPDPDLLPLELEEAWIDGIKAGLPELPDEKIARFMKDYGLTAYDAQVLTSERLSADFFEQVAKGRDGKMAANWVINDLLGLLKDTEDGITACPVKPEALTALVALVEAGKISNNQAKEVFAEMFSSGGNAADIVKAKGFEQVSDTGALEAIVEQILAANPDKVAEVKGGNDKAMNWFTGQAMKASQGKANPKIVTDIVRKKVLG
mgnify:CR=1 FL=1